jgi:uncharacterized protein YegL
MGDFKIILLRLGAEMCRSYWRLDRGVRPLARLRTPPAEAEGSEMSDNGAIARAAEVGQLVMPFYLIFDVSVSMRGDMKTLNQGLQDLRQAIMGEPVVDDVAQICIMTFSDTAKVVMPMSQISERAVLPTLKSEGGTNYGAAFRGVAQTIEQDSKKLKDAGYKVYRPCAFFLTDGAPNDRDWHKTFKSTLTYDQATGTGMKGHPIFVPFGYRNASANVLGQLAYPPGRARWYKAHEVSAEEALKGLLDIIMQTVVNSGQTAGSGRPSIEPPAPSSSAIRQGDSAYDPDYV